MIGFAAKIKQLNNLVTLDCISFFSDSKYQDMSFMNFLIIDFLYDHQKEEITQKDVEQQMVISRSTASKMLKLMEEKGFIVRKSSEQDSRKKIIILCTKGIKYREANFERLCALENYYQGILTEEERKCFDHIYKKLIAFHK